MANDLNKTRIDHLFSADIELDGWGFYPSVGGGVRVNSVPKGGEVFTQKEVIGEVVAGGKADFCTVDEIEQFAAGNISRSVDVYMASPIESTDPKLDKMFVFAVGRLDDAKAPKKLMLDLYEYECLPL